MALQRDQQYTIIPFARPRFRNLCETHGVTPTSLDVEAIKRVIGPESTASGVANRFEAALLFFLPKSAVEFEEDSLLIGWAHQDDGTKRQIWFMESASRRGSLYYLPGGPHNLRHSPEGSICDEWHPVILDILDPDNGTNRSLQYAYLRACVKLLQAAVPAPSIEDPRPALNNATAEPAQTLDAQVQERIRSFRERLGEMEVAELKLMLDNQPGLPSWTQELAKEVLQKKMLEELTLAENYFL
ncbi:hypothetical protein KCU78_g2792, partial [Aureobasidium melanogenum]